MKLKLIADGASSWARWMRRWGLSFIINDDILFDAFGDARVLMANLRRFKSDSVGIKTVIISHEHWDHYEGLKGMLEKYPRLSVYLPPRADRRVKEQIHQWGGNVLGTSEPVRLCDNIHLSGEIVGEYRHRDMAEQALVLNSAKGLVLVAGCAHPGIMNMSMAVSAVFEKPVRSIIGGFHLKDHSLQDIEDEARRLKSAGIRQVFPLHCTGGKAVRVFQRVFGAGCVLLREGQEVMFDE